MNTLEMLQNYWWLIIAVLGGVLVFMMFVQGGQSMLLRRFSEQERQLMVNSLGRKWELTFTTLVVFGGAFFASFPLFYSTSFGGAYWLWMAILFSFVLQAVSYEFRRKPGNLFGTRTYDVCLFINGLLGCVLLGVAVGMMFTGGEFSVSRNNLAEGTNPIISCWAPTHGLEAMANWQCLLLGVAVFFLARTLAAMYFVNNIRESARFEQKMRRSALLNGVVFVLLFVSWLAVLLLSPGLQAKPDGKIVEVPMLYMKNLLDMWGWTIVFVLGVLLVLWGIGITAFGKGRSGVWFSGFGSFLAVATLFAIAGYNHTAYLPSTLDAQSSLTLANSSSSLFTLQVMSVVSLLVPFVLAYIWYVWRKMNAQPLSAADISKDAHQY